MDGPWRRRDHRSRGAGGVAREAARRRGHGPHESAVSLSRRGASLAELVAALVVSALMALLAARIMGAAAAHLRDRSERIGLEHPLRVAGAGLRASLEPLGADSAAGTDLLDMAPDRLVV